MEMGGLQVAEHLKCIQNYDIAQFHLSKLSELIFVLILN